MIERFFLTKSKSNRARVLCLINRSSIFRKPGLVDSFFSQTNGHCTDPASTLIESADVVLYYNYTVQCSAVQSRAEQSRAEQSSAVEGEYRKFLKNVVC
jgi:hypothetical protein